VTIASSQANALNAAVRPDLVADPVPAPRQRTPDLGLPNHSPGNRAFGTISPAGVARVIQLGLKLYDWAPRRFAQYAA
jgi:hypothetical protein